MTRYGSSGPANEGCGHLQVVGVHVENVNALEGVVGGVVEVKLGEPVVTVVTFD